MNYEVKCSDVVSTVNHQSDESFSKNKFDFRSAQAIIQYHNDGVSKWLSSKFSSNKDGEMCQIPLQCSLSFGSIYNNIRPKPNTKSQLSALCQKLPLLGFIVFVSWSCEVEVNTHISTNCTNYLLERLTRYKTSIAERLATRLVRININLNIHYLCTPNREQNTLLAKLQDEGSRMLTMLALAQDPASQLYC